MGEAYINTMENVIEKLGEADSWDTIMLLYKASLNAIDTKLQILNDEFQSVHHYNPIEHIKSRLKEPKGIVDKLKRRGYDTTLENMVRYVNDIAGVRVICSFASDIYQIANMLASQADIKVLSVKDYIKNPKESGYKSYHMIVSIPIYLSEGPVNTKVEIQIRTVAMDFWASLEHKINYKFFDNVPEHIKRDLRSCAEMVSDLDAKMMDLNEQVRAL